MTRLRSLLLTMTACTLPIAHAQDASDEPCAAGKPHTYGQRSNGPTDPRTCRRET